MDGRLQEAQHEDRTDSKFLLFRHVKAHNHRNWDDNQIKI
jgi:hypothetical protein